MAGARAIGVLRIYSPTNTSNDAFQIDATTGVVTVADPTKIDYESAPNHSYTVTAQASDGTLTSAQSFAIAVTDAAPSTPTDSDAGKKVKGRKRQILVDTDGRALVLDLQPADVQDRDGAVPGLKRSRRAYPFIAEAFADAGYADDRPVSATLIAIEIADGCRRRVGLRDGSGAIPHPDRPGCARSVSPVHVRHRRIAS